MLAPKRVKHRKVHRGSMAGTASGNTEIHFGEYALKAMDRCWLTSNQIEAARIAMTRHVKRGGKIWIRIFPDKSYTKKPAETRMGSGKGAPEGWVAVVKPGRMLFEMSGVPEELAKEAMRLAAHTLPIATKFVTRKDQMNPFVPAAGASVNIGGTKATNEPEPVTGEVGQEVVPDMPAQAPHAPTDPIAAAVDAETQEAK